MRRLRKSAARPDLVADPDHAAAFYRKSALMRVGRFSSCFGDRLSSVDLGLTLQEAGYRSPLSAACRLLTAAPPAGTQGGLARGWSAERLFWRWLPATGRGKWLLLHGLRMAAVSAGAVVRPSRLLELLGATAAAAFARSPAQPAPAAPEEEPVRPHFRNRAARCQAAEGQHS